MTRLVWLPALAAVLVMAAAPVKAQVDDVCSTTGNTPSLDSPFAHVPYVFGRVQIKGLDPAAKSPSIVVILGDTGGTPLRWNVDKSGNYCFKRNASGGTLIVEVNGLEAGRRPLPPFGSSQQREDFE